MQLYRLDQDALGASFSFTAGLYGAGGDVTDLAVRAIMANIWMGGRVPPTSGSRDGIL